MIISFAHTTEAFLAGIKTVTRRDWSDKHFQQWLKAYEAGRLIHDAYDKSPRCHGKKVGQFELTCMPYREALRDMPESDLKAEGDLWDSLADFIGNRDPNHVVTVVRFRPILPE